MNMKTLIALGLLALPLAALGEEDVSTVNGGLEVQANPTVSSPFAKAVEKAREDLRVRLDEIRNSGAPAQEQAVAREEANKAYHNEVNRARAEARAARQEMLRKRRLSMDDSLEARLEQLNESVK